MTLTPKERDRRLKERNKEYYKKYYALHRDRLIKSNTERIKSDPEKYKRYIAVRRELLSELKFVIDKHNDFRNSKKTQKNTNEIYRLQNKILKPFATVVF